MDTYHIIDSHTIRNISVLSTYQQPSVQQISTESDEWIIGTRTSLCLRHVQILSAATNDPCVWHAQQETDHRCYMSISRPLIIESPDVVSRKPETETNIFHLSFSCTYITTNQRSTSQCIDIPLTCLTLFALEFNQKPQCLYVSFNIKLIIIRIVRRCWDGLDENEKKCAMYN